MKETLVELERIRRSLPDNHMSVHIHNVKKEDVPENWVEDFNPHVRKSVNETFNVTAFITN